MPRRRSAVPSYRLHKQSGQAVVTPTGRGKDVLLGPNGNADSRSEYARVIAEWEARSHCLPAASPSARPADLLISELILAFWRNAEQHYRHPDGTHTSEVEDFRLSLRSLRERYGHTPAAKPP
jgi:hypothetical protein